MLCGKTTFTISCLLTGRGTPERPRIVLVFFLGGVTYAEISALRFLSQREDGMSTTVLVATCIRQPPPYCGHFLLS